METLRLPQRPHDYTSIRFTGTTTTQPGDVIVEEDAGDIVQVKSGSRFIILPNYTNLSSLVCVCVARSVLSANRIA